MDIKFPKVDESGTRRIGIQYVKKVSEFKLPSNSPRGTSTAIVGARGSSKPKVLNLDALTKASKNNSPKALSERSRHRQFN